jgi:hypothetical protein
VHLLIRQNKIFLYTRSLAICRVIQGGDAPRFSP